MSARAILDLYDAGHRTQAIELARCLGGEAERLVLAMHRADWIREEIDALAESLWGCAWLAWARSTPGDGYPPTTLMSFMLDGHEHWENEYGKAWADLLALEAA